MPVKNRDGEIRNQHIIALTTAMLLYFPPISLFVNLICLLIFRRFVSFDSIVLYSILLFFVIWSLCISLEKIKLTTIAIPAFMLLAFFISYAVHIDLRIYMFTDWLDLAGNKTYWLFINSLPALLLIRRIWNYEILFKYLRIFSLISIAASIGTFIVYLSVNSQPGYMSFSYDLLMSVIWMWFAFFKGKRFLALFGAIVGSLLMFFCGARGPILCLVVAIVLYVLFMTDEQTVKVLLILATVFAVLLVLAFWEPLLNLLSQVAESIGVESRIVEKMRDGTLTDDSGRGEVRDQLLSQLRLFGYGLYGDRGITEGRYAHNFFLEIMVQYGLLVGSAIVIYIVILILAGFFTKDRDKKILFIAFFSASVIKLMMSSSYLSKEPALYSMFGICISCYFKDDIVPKEAKQRMRVVPAIELKRMSKRY